MSEFGHLREQSRLDPLLTILVGESGAGKTTFNNFVDRQRYCHSSSGFIKERLVRLGAPINHETIHTYAQEAYGHNPHWQVPFILGRLAVVPYLILDGPRRVEEVVELRRQHENTHILRIAASQEVRAKRIKDRDGIDDSVVYRIERHEGGQLAIGDILSMADQTVTNNGSIEDFQQSALDFQRTLDLIERRFL